MTTPVTTLCTHLPQVREQTRELQVQPDVLAAITANLYAENLALRRRLHGPLLPLSTESPWKNHLQP
ncbi:hypothetical protein [Streptomyces triticiradicis]|uniref:Uncharacterized protein n=1 Tax=Streptomyces triticiradicis TaxID=2651189 RepID=A0A7J5D475_9ACTN|nr:hypothetical protein [Streptomyces triticiradicis]KAB1978811.1 hypothetical protein F8144_37760 [Streptomyces triticiradicis]